MPYSRGQATPKHLSFVDACKPTVLNSFAFDGGVITRVQTGLTPEIDDVSMVTAGAGLLWVLGASDAICFDGQSWERIAKPVWGQHPGTAPVRLAVSCSGHL